MTTFKLKSYKWYEGGVDTAFAKWIHQNCAVMIDCIEGSLLDNYLFECKRGLCFVLESYVNSNMSEYVFHFIPYKETTKNNSHFVNLYQKWQKWQEAQEMQEGSI